MNQEIILINFLKIPGMKRNQFMIIVQKDQAVLIVIMIWNAGELMLIGEQNF